MEYFLNCELFSRYYAFTNIIDSCFADNIVNVEMKEEADILLADNVVNVTYIVNAEK